MNRTPQLFTLALLGLVAVLTSRPIQAASPGGRFDQRLNAVELKLRSAPARAKPPARRSSSPAPRAAQRLPRAARRRAAVRPSPSLRARALRVSRVERRRRVRRWPGSQPVPQRLAPGESPPVVTYTVTPRSSSAGGHEITGDLVLFTTGSAAPVEYRWDGGSRRTRETVVLKGMLAQDLRVAASAPGGQPSGWTWVPVKGNCITSVRFRFASR